ncbi:hypothetical protein LguiA_036307 [Lonicera macranthoides]
MVGVTCHCFRRARMVTSWTDLNPGRRFLTCGNTEKMQNNDCGFFRWVDPSMCERSRVVIPGLLRRINTIEAEVSRSKSREKKWFLLLILTWVTIFALIISVVVHK